MRPSLLTVGNFTIDRVQTPTARSAEDGELGGDCIYAAAGAHVWGVPVDVISVVGGDYPPAWLATLDAHGISTRRVRHIAEPHGLVAPMTYDQEGRRENEIDPEDAGDLDQAAVERWFTFSPTADDFDPSNGWPDGVHLAAMPVERQNAFLRLFSGRVRVITIDVPWAPRISQRGEIPEVGLATAVFLSDAESRGHFGAATPGDVAKAMFARGIGLVAIKQGGRGSLVFDATGGTGVSVPAYPAAVVDPSGAGDAYCGGFAVALLEGRAPPEAARFGTVAASFVIEGFGADHALQYTRTDAERRLRRLPG